MEQVTKIRAALTRGLLQYENTNGRKGKQITSGEALREIINCLIHMAINSKNDRDKLAAISLIADRLDGKAVQSITGNDGQPITVVQRIIVQQGAVEDKSRVIDINQAVQSKADNNARGLVIKPRGRGRPREAD